MKPTILALLALVALCAADITDGDKKLVFSQIIWRHGDRSPTITFKSDRYQEKDWTFGGTGFGQLSPDGMRQHFKLGQRMKTKYIGNYLSNFYNSREIYVRSTDVNRTIISAMSNMLGFYSTNVNNRAGVDYPNFPGWPVNYVPVAIHTVDYDTDFVLNADASCDRQSKLWEMAKQSDELKAFINSTDTQYVLNTLTANCGETITIDNLWIVVDALLIENIHFPGNPNKWYTQDLYDKAAQVNDQVELYQNGIFKKQIIMNHQDIGIELQKIRGGSTVKDVLYHMNLKMSCAGKTTSNCKWINDLKYHVYSAHDTTIYAFLSCFGIEQSALNNPGYPMYSAATLIELFQDQKTNAYSFKMSYHQHEDADFDVITQKINGCEGTYCDLSAFETVAATVNPGMPVAQLCTLDPNAPLQSAALSFTATIFAFVTLVQYWF